MKKRGILTILLLSILLAFTACGGSDTGEHAGC